MPMHLLRRINEHFNTPCVANANMRFAPSSFNAAAAS